MTDREQLEWIVFLALDINQPIISISRGKELLGFKDMNTMREWLRWYEDIGYEEHFKKEKKEHLKKRGIND